MTTPARWIGGLVLAAIVIGALVSVRFNLRQANGQVASPSETANAPATAAIKSITLPDLSKSSPAAQTQISQSYARLTQKTQNRTYPADAAKAYGEYGMLLMAAEYYDEAIPALEDAETLDPSEMRWPYYLAHIYRTRGDTPNSTAAFERAVRDKPDYAPALVWLGNAYLDQGKPEAAEPLFSKALTIDPRLVAALFGRGRAALARRDYTRAIADFEQALAYDPNATAVHYPLALAYRGAGQVDKAQAHLLGNTAGELRPPDPVLDEKDGALESPMAYELRGDHALANGQWDAAVSAFRQGVALEPGDAALHHKLGTALAMKGDARGAMAEFQETTRRSPDYAKAHYSLALLLASEGQVANAEAEFARALKSDPNYVEAHLQLAQLLRHTGRPAAAVPHFEKVIQLDPRVADARIGYTSALVQLRRYAAARDALQEAMQLSPEHPAFAVALARLLAAAPDDRVRDGRRALDLLQGVPADTQRTYDWGIAMAMALAEVGRFDDAIAIQRKAVEFARGGGDARLQAQLAANLDRYEHQRPCRQPWSDAETMELVDRPQD